MTLSLRLLIEKELFSLAYFSPFSSYIPRLPGWCYDSKDLGHRLNRLVNLASTKSSILFVAVNGGEEEGGDVYHSESISNSRAPR